MAVANTRIALLGSHGGDVHAAMDIGRFLRRHEFTTGLMPGSMCHSACVFILAAGVDKRIQEVGSIGIHRPYLTARGEESPGEAIRRLKAEAEAYFDEMNIPLRLVEDMFSIEPAEMRILTAEELRDYRLDSTDYACSEERAIRLAESYGLSRQSYEAFCQDLNYSCEIYSVDSRRLIACMNEVAERHGVESLPDLDEWQ